MTWNHLPRSVLLSFEREVTTASMSARHHLPHVDPRAPRGRFYRAYARAFSTRAANWLSKHLAWKADPWLLRVTRGRLGFALVIPTAILETRGARTGLVRRHAVIYFHD